MSITCVFEVTSPLLSVPDGPRLHFRGTGSIKFYVSRCISLWLFDRIKTDDYCINLSQWNNPLCIILQDQMFYPQSITQIYRRST